MLKFGTFNILNSNYVHFNNRSCRNIQVVSVDDEYFRNSILIKLFENNEFDILFLQEVSSSFLKLLDKSTLKIKYHVTVHDELMILINNNILGNVVIMDNNKYTHDQFILKRLLGMHCKIYNNDFILINIHLPSSSMLEAKNTILAMITKIIKQNLNANFIIAGDMNTENYVMSYLDKHPYNIKSIINKEMKDTYATSFKLGKCENNKFQESNKESQHFFIDDIYTSQNISNNDINIIASYDETYKFISEKNNTNPKFKNLGTPYCDPKKYAENGFCEIDPSKEKYSSIFSKEKVKPWPSDHALLYVVLNLKSIVQNPQIQGQTKQPVQEPINQQIREPIEQPKQEPIMRPIQESVKQSIQGPTKQPKKESIRRPIQKPIKQSVTAHIEQSIEKPIKRSVQEPIKQQIQEPINQSIQEPINQSIQEPIKRLIQEPMKQPIQELMERSDQKVINQSTQEPINQSIQEPIKRLIQEPMKQPIQEPMKRSDQKVINQSTQELFRELIVFHKEIINDSNEVSIHTMIIDIVFPFNRIISLLK